MKLIKIDVLYSIKKNIGYYYNLFNNGKIEDKLKSEFGSAYYEESDYIFQSLNLDMSVKEEGRTRKQTDYNNSIEIYEKYNYLTESQASDERFWASLALYENNMDYLFYRWGNTEKTLKYRLTYHESGKRGYMYHGLARPWWFAHLTYDEGHDNPYHLTRFTYDYPHIMEKMIYRNFSNSKKIRHIVIKSIKEYIDNCGKYSTANIDKLYKYIGILGSNKLLDIYDESLLKNLLIEYLKSLDKE